MGFDKVNLVVRGKPLWRYSFDTFLAHADVEAVGLVSHAVYECREAAFVVPGGANRTESSRAGLDAVPTWAEVILVHDAARPLVSPQVISRVIEGVRQSGAASPVIPIVDTIKQVNHEQIKTLLRSELVATQTPQGALRQHLEAAHRMNKGTVTDDMVMIESLGIKPTLVEGEERNFKVTTMDDLIKFGAILGQPETRTGFGYDIHRFSDDPTRPLMLGGVHFPDHPALMGHSDADVVIHAVVDSLLGAAALGDIGVHFPNSDPRWKNCPSLNFLVTTGGMLAAEWEIVNIDIAVIAETPKIMARSSEILIAISGALKLETGRVSIKATTNELLGAIGRSEGIAAFATATIRQRF